MKKIKSKFLYIFNVVFVFTAAFILCYPIIIILINSFESPGYVIEYYYSGNELLHFRYVPEMLSFKQYFEALIGNIEYVTAMVRSILYTIPITIIQILIAIPTGYGLAVYCDKGKKIVISGLLFLMLIPYQAVEIPLYLFLRKIHIIGTPLSIIIQNIFHPLPILTITLLINNLGKDYFEAAELDGASAFMMLIKIVLPQIISGILITFIIQFVDVWSMTEQPLIFLDKTKEMPLSVLLPDIITEHPGEAFGYSIVFMLPIMLLYISFREEIEYEVVNRGIEK